MHMVKRANSYQLLNAAACQTIEHSQKKNHRAKLMALGNEIGALNNKRPKLQAVTYVVAERCSKSRLPVL